MSASTIQRHLVSIRNGFRKVDALTRQLGTQPTQEDLESILIKREAVVSAEIDFPARELTAAYPNWREKAKSDGALKGLLDEAEACMRSIMRMDEVIGAVVRRRMADVQASMGSLTKTSRAAGSYIAYSMLPARRRNAGSLLVKLPQ